MKDLFGDRVRINETLMMDYPNPQLLVDYLMEHLSLPSGDDVFSYNDDQVSQYLAQIQRQKKRLSPLSRAVYEGQVAVFKLYCAQGKIVDEPNYPLAILAVASSSVKMVQQIIDSGRSELFSATAVHDITPLALAVALAQSEMVKLLVQYVSVTDDVMHLNTSDEVRALLAQRRTGDSIIKKGAV